MPRRTRRRLDISHGFTLIEVLVVVIIIGLLAAIAIPAYAKHREKAVMASVVADLNQSVAHGKAYILETRQGLHTSACFTVADCAPVQARLETEGMQFSPGNVIGSFWGGQTFFLCVEHVNDDGQATAYRAFDTVSGGVWGGKGYSGGCPWVGVWDPPRH